MSENFKLKGYFQKKDCQPLVGSNKKELIINIPKKIIKSSVDRNRIKRRVRHVVREYAINFSGKIFLKKDMSKAPFSVLKEEICTSVNHLNKEK